MYIALFVCYFVICYSSTRHASLAADPATNWVQSCSACLWLCPRYLPFVLLRHLHPTHWSSWKSEASFCAPRGPMCASTRTEFGKRSFRVAASRTWNSLPLHLRSPTVSRQQFQSGLKTHLFKRAYIWLLPPRTIEEWTYLLTYLLIDCYHFDE